MELLVIWLIPLLISLLLSLLIVAAGARLFTKANSAQAKAIGGVVIFFVAAPILGFGIFWVLLTLTSD